MPLKSNWTTGDSFGAADINAIASQVNTTATDVSALSSATMTFTNKTLADPKINSIKDTNGNHAFLITPVTSAVNYLQTINSVAGNSPQLRAAGGDTNISLWFIPKGSGSVGVYAATGLPSAIQAVGADTNHNLNLIPKGSGTVQANGVPVVTTTGAQAITNKTISGSSNTITNLPASATPLASRRVGTTADGGTGAEDGANTWAKLMAWSPGSNQHTDLNVILGVVPATSSAGNVAIVSVYFRAFGTGTNPTVDVQMLARGGGSQFYGDSFKVISGGFGTDCELWVKKTANYQTINVYELAVNYQIAPPTYFAASAWQSTEPTGAVNNVRSNGVTAFGVPVVTTTDTQTLTDKTLTAPKVDVVNDSVQNKSTLAINAYASAVNYLAVTANVTGSAPRLTAVGSDTNISLDLLSKGSGTVQANGVPVVTTSGAQTLTNKTIAASSNTISGISSSSVSSEIARFVRTTGSTVSGQWIRIFSFAAPAAPYIRFQATYAISVFSYHGAIVSVNIGTSAADNVNGSVEIISKGTSIPIADDSFKIVCNGYGQPFELWFRAAASGSVLSFYEISRYGTSYLTYDTGTSWTATEPVGTVLNTVSFGVCANGVQVITGKNSGNNFKYLTDFPIVFTPGLGGFVNGLQNDLAFLKERGGSIVSTRNGVDVGDISALFRGTPQYLSGGSSVNDVYVFEITLPSVDMHPNDIYCLGVHMYGSVIGKNVTIEIYRNSAWTIVYSITDSSSEFHWVKPSISLTGTTKYRFTITNLLQAGSLRLFNIFSVGAGYGVGVNSASTMLSKAGGSLYGTSSAPPTLTAAGADANISLNLVSKGTGTVQANGNPVVTTVSVPAAATSTGKPGQIAYGSSYLYVCTATDTWRRTTLSTW